MYTQCPQCEAAFRITVDVLQQARGQVLCGSCDHAFNALDHLSEEPPSPPPAPVGDSDEDLERSQLLETLDRLAGHEDVRIEDTGVEWRVVDETEERADDVPIDDGPVARVAEDAEEAFDDEISDTAETAENPALPDTAASIDEPRYDDNTPLPDDFEEQHQLTASSPPPQRRATDRFEFTVEDDNAAQADLELSEPDDWSDLLSDLSAPAEAVSAEGDADEATSAVSTSAAANPVEEVTAEDAERSDASDADALETSLPDADEAASLAAAMGPEPDAEEEIAMVASQLDDLLETMGAEPLGEPDADSAPEATESYPDAEDTSHGEQSIPYTAEEQHDHEPQAETAELRERDAEPVGERTDDDEREGLDDPAGGDTESADEIEYELESESEPEAEPKPETEPEPEIEPTEEPETLDTPPEATGPAAGAADEDRPELRDATAPEDGEHEDVDAAADIGDPSLGENTAAPDPTADGEDEEDAIAAMTANMAIDADMLRAMQDAEYAATMTQADGSPLVETIIMEGDRVSADLADHEARRGLEKLTDPASFLDTYISNLTDETKGTWKSRKWAVGTALFLLVLLIAQAVHYSRESLATTGAFQHTIAPLYRLLGDPVTPNWNIKGWQFEATNGSTDESDSILTIYSRLSNRTDASLPYPMVHVALTDRFEEIIGSRMLEPDEYLAGSADPDRPVASGANFTAVITIASPSAEATGFKLNVCYPAGTDQVRCAIEDFKAP